MGHLDGKVAVVTGAGRGIGRGEALLLAAEGAAVVVNDVGAALDGGAEGAAVAEEVAQQIRSAGGRAAANTDDVSTWEGAKRLVDQAVGTFGDLNIVVNNAGVVRDRMSFNMDEDDFDTVIRVHVKGHFATARFAAAYWRGRSKAGEPVYGRIVNTTSEAGLWGTPGQANYAAAKGAIASMTLTLAREMERFGVTVNAIAPRARTRMTESIGAQIGDPDAPFDEWDPDNVAPAVAWLASEAAAGVSGHVFMVFGGRVHLIEGHRDVSSISKPGRWTVAELAERQAELFAGRPVGVPGFAITA